MSKHPELDAHLDAFGQQVRAERRRQRLSLPQLAELVPTARLGATMLGAIESGRRRPTLAHTLAIAAALGVPVSALLAELPHRARRCAACASDAEHARRQREASTTAHTAASTAAHTEASAEHCGVGT